MSIREDFEKAYSTANFKDSDGDFVVALWAAKWAIQKCINSADCAASFDVEHQIPDGLRQLARELE